MKKLAALLAALTLCACAAQEKQPAPLLPAFPPAPVDTTTPIGPPMLPWLECIVNNGSHWSGCLTLQPSTSASSTTVSEPKP